MSITFSTLVCVFALVSVFLRAPDIRTAAEDGRIGDVRLGVVMVFMMGVCFGASVVNILWEVSP